LTDEVRRKLTTILAADVVAFSRMTAIAEAATVKILDERVQVLNALLHAHNGRLFKTTGDGALAEFNSPVEAVRLAIEFQEAMRTMNLTAPAEQRMHFRIGINIGDVTVKNGDLLGDGVNIAARLEAAAPPEGICVSNGVFEQLIGKLTIRSQDLGMLEVKNIPRPIHAHVLLLDCAGVPTLSQSPNVASGFQSRKPLTILAACVGLIVVATLGWLLIRPVIKPAVTSLTNKVLDPDAIPMIPGFARTRVREVYLSGPEHKALALSGLGNIGMAIGRETDDVARSEALSSCNSAQRGSCEIYAVGNAVVWTFSDPPMPQGPYVPTVLGPKIPFDPDKVPLLANPGRDFVVRNYNPSESSALAMGQTGGWSYMKDDNAELSARRWLQICGFYEHGPCTTIAVGGNMDSQPSSRAKPMRSRKRVKLAQVRGV
jgi:class 3 adenylate cyclase